MPQGQGKTGRKSYASRLESAPHHARVHMGKERREGEKRIIQSAPSTIRDNTYSDNRAVFSFRLNGERERETECCVCVCV